MFMVGCMCPTLESIAKSPKTATDVRVSQKRAKTPADESRLSRFHHPTSPSCRDLPIGDVMAAHSAVRAINTQDITAKSERDLLQLLEAVCKAVLLAYRRSKSLICIRSEARRTWSLSGLWLVLLDSSSSSAGSKNTVSIRSSSLRTTTSMQLNATSSSWFVGRLRRKRVR